MALKLLAAFGKYPVRFTAFAAFAFMLTATSTHAGFEWIPAKEKPTPTTPAPVFEESPITDTGNTSDSVLPMPVTSETLEPLPVEPQVLALPPSQQTLQAPQTQPTPVPVIQTKSFRAPVAAPLPAPAQKQPQNLLSLQSTDAPAPPPAVQAPAPVSMPAQQTRIMMPEDAPQAARKQAENLNPGLSPASAATPSQRPQSMLQKMAEPERAPAPQPQQNLETSYEVHEGFGTDMPLAIALTQIVPPSYAYAFGTNVNPGQRVSWNGGKPWPDTINDMIAPLGLQALVQNRMVVIRSIGGAMADMPVQKSSIESTPLPENPPVDLAINENATPVNPVTDPVLESSKDQTVDIYEVRRQIINDPGTARTNQPEQTLEMIKDTTAPAPELSSAKSPRVIPPAEDMDATADMLKDMDLPAKDMEENEKQALKEKPAVLEKRPEVKAEGPTSPQALPPTFADLPKPLLQEVKPPVKKDEIIAIPDTAELSAPSVQPAAKGLWEAQKGDSLRRTLDGWSKKANLELVWESSHDYTIESDIMVSGDVQRALKMVFSQGLSAGKAPSMTFIERTNNQPGKLVIQDGSAG